MLVVGNLAVSLVRGEPAGSNPWDGDTLEWATSSPPPPYNYAVIPTVTSPYPMWDKRDRERDSARLERGEGVLARGHETPASSVQDADLDEILSMPPHSLAPFVAALVLTLIMIMLLIGHYLIAVGAVGVGAVVLAAWHGKEPAHV
jgi:cytochrome c oxidase subunit 1/cytochrome c oxidase subunit I+III